MTGGADRQPAFAIIGSGPAGTEAALHLAARGAAVDVFDEQPRAGGNVGRVRRNAEPTRLETSAGADGTLRLLRNTRVLRVSTDRCVEFATTGAAGRRHYDAVLLCCGAYDMHLPLPGLPAGNVSSCGALQALLKSEGAVPRGNIVVAGSGPFLYVVAAQLIRAGARVTCVIDRLRRRDYAQLAIAGVFAPANAAEYLKTMRTLRRAGTPLRRGAHPRYVDGRTLTLDRGRPVTFDHLGFTDLFIPQTQLARTAGCRQTYNRTGGYYVTETDAFFRSSVPRVYVCGEGGGIRGWRHARLSGRLAARAALAEATGRQRPRLPLLRLRAWLARRFPAALEKRMREAEPPATDPATIVCACEGVPASAVLEVGRLGLNDLSSVKNATRCGMGPCQGRYCEALVCRALEDLGMAPRSPFTQHTLVRPMSVEEFVGEI